MADNRLRAPESVKEWLEGKKKNKNENAFKALMEEFPEVEEDFKKDQGGIPVMEKRLEDLF